MSTNSEVRELDRATQLQEGTWVIDSAHSSIEAVARHMMISKVRGRFHDFSGAIHVDPDRAKSWAEATIKATSIDTTSPDRDNHLRSPDFLDVENHPETTFRSTSLTDQGDGRYVARGDLTIRGLTKPVTLKVTFHGVAVDPFGNTKGLFSATGKLDREDWGITWNAALESGGVLVSKSLDFEIEAQVVRQS
jgi:polyisoprenoid-binding protein YceI